MWIGTLFMLVVAGLGTVLSGAVAPRQRGALTAAMVRAFSPVALGSAALLATMGVITAWQHLHRLEALWTTPYGYALIAKLCAVGGVLLLGAYNWRRQSPRLGDEASAGSLRHSATTELMAALVVLIVTAILVSLPSPKALRPDRGSRAGSAGAPAYLAGTNVSAAELMQ
jgi:putative copper export protein